MKDNSLLNIIKRIMQIIVGLLIFALLMFVPAGRLDWPGAWIYLGTSIIYMSIVFLYMRKKNPIIFKVRQKKHTGTKKYDLLIIRIYTLLLGAMYIVAGLEIRYAGPAWGLVGVISGVLLMMLAGLPAALAMGVNPHFEQTIRIQSDRDHQVISTGPYRYVRHPGYVGVIGIILATPLMLGASWSFIPAVLIMVLFIIRTAMEDRTLRGELTGYADYAARVRYRLIPGLW